MRISDVEKLVGISKKNIRFYEEQGLLSPKRESQNGYRVYSEAEVEQLRRVRLLRKLAVPIEEIRSLINGKLTLADCMKRHEIYLNNELRNIEHMKTVCGDIAADGATIESIDTEIYNQKISMLEKGGARFMKITADEGKKQRRKSAIFWAIMTCSFFLILIAMFIWASSDEPMPLAVLFLITGMFILMIVGVLAALKERLREIDKGEEDEAFKY